MQHGNDLEWDCLRAVDDHIVREFRDGPEPHRQWRYVSPFGSHQRMFSQTAARGDDFHFHPVGGIPVVFGYKAPIASRSSVACGVN